jgi:pectinesterase
MPISMDVYSHGPMLFSFYLNDCVMTRRIWLTLTLIVGLSWSYLPAKATSTLSPDLVVAQDGSGDYLTVQAAIDAAPSNSQTETVIWIKSGVYREKILVPASKTHLTLLGESVDSTIIVWDDYSGRVVNGIELGTSTSYTFQADPDHFKAQNLTIANDATIEAQAVALLVNGDKNTFYHCKLVGNQDTYYTKGYGRIYMKDCYIEGTTDFIFGRAVVVFDSCLLVCKKASYLTAASTEQAYQFGYVFFDCQLSAMQGVYNVSLGRPWRPYARTVFLRSYLDLFVSPYGWSEWGGNDNHTTCFYAEYANIGPRADRTYRRDWTIELTDSAAAAYTIPNIFAQTTAPSEYSDDWMPMLDSLPYAPYVDMPAATQLSNLSEKIDLKVYPNPTDSNLVLKLTLNQPQPATLRLFDANGRMVHAFPTEPLPAGAHTWSLALPLLAPGQYVYRLQLGNQEASGRLQLR